jgi:hypothetical protein
VRDDGEYLRGAVLVMDEAHIYRRVTAAMVPILHAFAFAIYVFNLTGTPLMNQPDDWTGLEMYMGLRPVHDMSKIKKDPMLTKLHALPTTGGEFKALYDALKNKVFYYRPEMPIPTQRLDIKVGGTCAARACKLASPFPPFTPQVIFIGCSSSPDNREGRGEVGEST